MFYVLNAEHEITECKWTKVIRKIEFFIRS